MGGPRKTCESTEARLGTETKLLIDLQGFSESERVFAKGERERESKRCAKRHAVINLGKSNVIRNTSNILRTVELALRIITDSQK